MKSVAQNLLEAEKSLHKAKIGTARLDAELLLVQVLDHDRGWLLAHDEDGVPTMTQRRFDAAVRRRAAHEPLAYIIGYREFYGLDFMVDKSVLIPRVETEVMVEQIIARRKSGTKFQSITKLRLLDIGTGCSAIAIALAKNLPGAQVLATDVSAAALRVAKQNAAHHGVNKQIDFVQSDLFAKINGTFDIIAANLPYVPHKIKDRLAPDLSFEPSVALYGGTDGLDHYRQFFANVQPFLADKAQVWCEADPWQHKILIALAQKAGLQPIFEDYLVLGFANS